MTYERVTRFGHDSNTKLHALTDEEWETIGELRAGTAVVTPTARGLIPDLPRIKNNCDGSVCGFDRCRCLDE